MAVQFNNNTMRIIAELNEAAISFLYEAGGELEAEVKRNTRVDTGQLKSSWAYKVDESEGKCTVGSPLENAIWEEYGTGEYAVNDDGRKGGWTYQDAQGDYHFTFGKSPNRTLERAFTSKKSALINRAGEVLRERFDE